MRKDEGGQTTYYVRSSALGGQVVAEVSGAGAWARGHVYLGGQALAAQEGNSVSWVHEDPVTKTKKRTDSSGAVTSTTLVDPWGGEVSGPWVENPTQQRRKFTSYERDANDRDEAQQRSYSAWHSRFDQPDPYDGSYDLTDPQSLNRYSYVQGDPVNFVDPSGLIRYIGPAPGIDPLYLRFLFFTPGARGTGGDEGGGGSQGPVGPVVDESDLGPPPSMGCDRKLAKIFGGPGAVVGSTHDPWTLDKFSSNRAYHAASRIPLRPSFGDRGYGHGPEPVPPIHYPEDVGGIIHIYGNARGTATNTGLYAPRGGVVGQMFVTRKDNSQINVTYNKGPYAGMRIAFVHVSPGSGGPNAMGSVRIGNIGGRGGDGAGYIHTHLVFFKNGVRVDPRTIFCKEFGF